jgi:hypothetical protein
VNALGIRDNGKVRELNIPKDKLEVLEKIVYSNTIMDQTKHSMIRNLTEGSPCLFVTVFLLWRLVSRFMRAARPGLKGTATGV